MVMMIPVGLLFQRKENGILVPPTILFRGGGNVEIVTVGLEPLLSENSVTPFSMTVVSFALLLLQYTEICWIVTDGNQSGFFTLKDEVDVLLDES